jgi:hypothetical protein
MTISGRSSSLEGVKLLRRAALYALVPPALATAGWGVIFLIVVVSEGWSAATEPGELADLRAYVVITSGLGYLFVAFYASLKLVEWWRPAPAGPAGIVAVAGPVLVGTGGVRGGDAGLPRVRRHRGEWLARGVRAGGAARPRQAVPVPPGPHLRPRRCGHGLAGRVRPRPTRRGGAGGGPDRGRGGAGKGGG